MLSGNEGSSVQEHEIWNANGDVVIQWLFSVEAKIHDLFSCMVTLA